MKTVHYRACHRSHGALREKILRTPRPAPSLLLVESGASTCCDVNITRSLRWKFIRRRTIIESDGVARRGRDSEEDERRQRTSFRSLTLEKSLARQKRRPWHASDAFPRNRFNRVTTMTRHPVVLVVVVVIVMMVVPGGGGEPRRVRERERKKERVLTYGRGSQAWEPKLAHKVGSVDREFENNETEDNDERNCRWPGKEHVYFYTITLRKVCLELLPCFVEKPRFLGGITVALFTVFRKLFIFTL